MGLTEYSVLENDRSRPVALRVIRHSRESGDPAFRNLETTYHYKIPAFAGMTELTNPPGAEII